MGHIDKLSSSENWKRWAADLEANLTMSDLWDDLVSGEKINSSDNKKLYAVLMLTTADDAWEIVMDSKNKGLSAGEAYLALKSEFYHTDFASVVTLWESLHAYSGEFTSVEAYGRAITTAYNRLEQLGLKLPNWVLTMTILRGLDDSWSLWKTQYFTSRDLTAEMLKDDGKADKGQLNSRRLLSLLKEQERRQQKEDFSKALKINDRGRHSKRNNNKSSSSSRKPNKDSGNKHCKECYAPTHNVETCWYKNPSKAPANSEFKRNANDPERLKKMLEKTRKKWVDETNEKGKSGDKVKDKEDQPGRALNMRISLVSKSSNTPSSEWLLDSAAGRHMTGRRDWIDNFRPMAPCNPMETATKEIVRAEGIGTVQFHVIVKGRLEEFKLTKVYYYPGLDSNLISFGHLEEKGAQFQVENGVISVSKDGDTYFEACRTGNIYVANSPWNDTSDDDLKRHKACAAKKGDTIQKWHNRMGHLNTEYLRRMPNQVEGMTFATNELPFCETCVMSKAHKQHNHMPARHRAKDFLERIHMDLCGGGETLSAAGNRYFCILTDDATRWRDVLLLRTKGEVKSKLPHWIKKMETQSGKTVRFARSDRGREFFGAMDKYYKSKGITYEPSAPHAQDQNGVAERANRTITEKARALTLDSGMPLSLWGYAIDTAVKLSNLQPNRSIGYKTPHEARFDEKPDVSHLREWGCAAYVYDYAQNKKKLDARAWEGRLVGYEGTNQYLIWNGIKAYTRRDVTFNEDKKGPLAKPGPSRTPEGVTIELYRQEAPPPSGNDEIDNILDLIDDFQTQNRTDVGFANQDESDTERSNNSRHSTASPSIDEPEGAEATQDIDEGVNLDDNHEEVAPTITVRRSGRNTERRNYRALAYEAIGRDKMANKFRKVAAVTQAAAATKFPIDTNDDCPKTYDEAMMSKDRHKWLAAMKDELQSQGEQGTWILVDKPQKARVLQGRWVFKKKLKADGTVDRYKARWVARGFEQRDGIDYEQTYAPVVRAATSKILQSIAIVKGWSTRQWDVKTAFLNGKLDRWLYIKQPTGFQDASDKVCMLVKPLYGLKQAGYEWYQELSEQLIKMGFIRSQLDEALYMNHEESTYVTLYVDDMRAYGPNDDYLDKMNKRLGDKYTMSDATNSNLYLGMEVTKDEQGGVLLTQQRKIEDGLKELGLEDCNAVKTPMEGYLQPPPEGHQATSDDKARYQRYLGITMHLACYTRPDIAFPTSCLAQYAANPTNEHWEALKRLWRYLRGTKTMGCYYRRGSGSDEPLGWTDSNWNELLNDGRSTSGYVFLLAGGPVSWSSKKQDTVATSTTVAEYYAQYHAATELSWIRELI